MHAAGLHLERDVIEDRRTAKDEADVGKIQGRASASQQQVFLNRHAPDSWIARTTVLRLPFISFSYLSAVYSP
ncbi:hypothetical protein D3C76_1768610 [compost metagenome]